MILIFKVSIFLIFIYSAHNCFIFKATFSHLPVTLKRISVTFTRTPQINLIGQDILATPGLTVQVPTRRFLVVTTCMLRLVEFRPELLPGNEMVLNAHSPLENCGFKGYCIISSHKLIFKPF